MLQDQESALYADGGVSEKGSHAAWDPYLDKATFFRDKKRKIGQLRSSVFVLICCWLWPEVLRCKPAMHDSNLIKVFISVTVHFVYTSFCVGLLLSKVTGTAVYSQISCWFTRPTPRR